MDSTNVAGAWMRRSDHSRFLFIGTQRPTGFLLGSIFAAVGGYLILRLPSRKLKTPAENSAS